MVMYRLARLFLVVLLAGGVVVSAGEAALACSCAVGDPASRLAESDAAFVGGLISSAEPVTDSKGNISTADPVAWVFEVEEAVKGDLETPLTVMSPWSGASCGFKVRIGERIGVLLREDGGWRSGRCSQLDADVLLRAAAPLPTPTSDDPRYWTEHGEVWALPAGSRSPTQLASFDTPLLYGAVPVPASAVPEPVPATSSATGAPTTTVTVTSTAPAATTTSTAPPPSADPSAALADDAPAGRDANALALLLAAVSLVLVAAGALAWRSRTLRRRRSA